MEFKEFIKMVHGGIFPFYWIKIGKNIIITKGKTGTNTLKHYSDVNSETSYMNLYTMLENVYNGDYKIHALIREPNSRFKSGIFQEVLMLRDNLSDYSKDLNKLNFDNINEWNDKDWIFNLENFIITFINILSKDRVGEYTFHTGNWLHHVKYLMFIIPNNSLKIWKHTEFSRLLSYLDCDIEEKIVLNSAENKPFINEYIKAYSKINDNVKNKISKYLENEVKIWNELTNNDDEYISVFDRL
jgi:hypothetical protein